MADAQVLVTQGKVPGLRPLMLLIGIATAVAAGVAVMLWWQGPNWSLLYANLQSADAGQVTQALSTAGIKYKLNDSNGAIMVPADKVSQARLQLASQGLPGSTGIEMISKETGLGVSQFMETARYQYALEQELARTIGSLRNVEAARVHLAIPQQSAFVRDRRVATASVLLQLKQGSRLDEGQVQAIVHLVASSIPELDSKQVTIVDQQGHLLSSPDRNGGAIASEQLEAAQRLEESYVQRIEQLLIPLVGVGRVRAQVAVDLDAATIEQTHEQYAPNSGIVRSEQTSEATSKGAGGALGGVPGSLTNQPPAGGALAANATNATPPAAAANAAAATGAAATAAAAAASPGAVVAPDNVTRQASRSYEIDRTLSYNKQPGGRVKRVTVAVLLDNAHKLGADGKETSEALPAAQIEDITRLVKNAVGFDEARGDSVGVVNAAFREDKEVLTPEVTPIWQKPWVQDIARLALGALVLLALALGVLRPLIRNLTAQVVPPAPAKPALASAGSLGADGSAHAALGAPRPAMQLEQQIADAKSMLAQDPRRAAQVVKTWVGER